MLLCFAVAPAADAAGPLPVGYSIAVDESGTTASGNLGGTGSLQASGQGNVNYGYAKECAPSLDGGPFSIGHYPPLDCTGAGRSFSTSGSPEQPSGFWFTGNQYCANVGRPLSGATFTWHVQLPQSGHWHVDVYIPSWTSYGFGNQYTLGAGDGQDENGFTQQTYHGQWVSLFRSHLFNAAQDYPVVLTPVDSADSNCHYQMADQMRWVFDGPLAPSSTAAPAISGQTTQGQTLTEVHGSWDNYPTSYAYQWEDCNPSGGGCVPISGATGQTYTLTEGDVGHTLVVQETATNSGGTGSPASSAATDVVVSASSSGGSGGGSTGSTGSSGGSGGSPMCTPSPAIASGVQSGQASTAHAASARSHQIARMLNLAHAIAKTTAKRARRFNIALVLTTGMAHFFDSNQVCPQTLRGSGFVNFRQLSARWTVSLPSVFHGTLNVIAIRNRTYVSTAEFTRGRRHSRVWIELTTSSDYKTFDKLTILRDIVVLTNPLRALDVLRSTRSSTGRHRRSNLSALGRLAADSQKLTASCARDAHPVASNDVVDAKQLIVHSEINTQAEGDSFKQWAKSTVNADADKSGVCELSISAENIKHDGFDVVIDFTNSTPKASTIKGPRSTATVEWKTVYHVKKPACLDGTWESTETGPLPIGGGTYTVTAKAEISGNTINWTRDDNHAQIDTYSYVSPLPPYELIMVPDFVTSISNYDNASGTLIGIETGGVGSFSTNVIGKQTDSTEDTAGSYPPGNVFTETLDRPMTLDLNCAAGVLTVEQFRTLTVGPPLSHTLHKTSATPPPEITTEQNWRAEISAPVQSGS